ncbi:MAG: hypothetical protein WBA76_09730 [Phormidesmis sp.]
MCVGCLVISTLTFIVPVSDVPVSNVPQAVNGSAVTTLATSQPESTGIATVEKEIQAVLAQLPDSEDAEFLQEGLETTLARLDTATTDQQAQAIIDEEVNKLSEEFAAAPNADQVIDILLDIRDSSPNGNFLNNPNSSRLQSSASGVLMPAGLQLNQRSGWLS